MQILKLMGYLAQYEAYGLASRALVVVYFAAPREGVQAEVGRWQRECTIRAHTARKRAEALNKALSDA